MTVAQMVLAESTSTQEGYNTERVNATLDSDRAHLPPEQKALSKRSSTLHVWSTTMQLSVPDERLAIQLDPAFYTSHKSEHGQIHMDVREGTLYHTHISAF
eukprot:4208126-Amphidinium_carterae.1